jgi:hypothetical protein
MSYLLKAHLCPLSFARLHLEGLPVVWHDVLRRETAIPDHAGEVNVEKVLEDPLTRVSDEFRASLLDGLRARCMDWALNLWPDDSTASHTQVLEAARAFENYILRG